MYETTVVTWSNIHEYGSLWYQHLTLRKQLFVDTMGWDIPHNGKVEWDQYDTGNSIYIITHRDGIVIAASRINPCSFSSPLGSFMIGDAAKGLLPGIPEEILTTPDVFCPEETWEATRFAVDPTLDADERNEALRANALALADAAKEKGISKLVALMPPAYIRWLTRIGLPTRRIGPTQKGAEDRRFCVMEMAL